jgi:hypothetical protein
MELNRRHRSITFSSLSTLALSLLAACGSEGEPTKENDIGTLQAPLDGANGIAADLVLDSQWGQGYCAHVVVRNQHPSATTGSWSVQLGLGAATTFTTWDAAFSAQTGTVTANSMSHNAAIAPSQSKQFGFCASIPTAGLTPTLLGVTSDLPSTAVTREYKFAAAIDPLVNPDVATELWASFYRPATLAAGKKYPLVVLLHGNHPTCGTGSNPRRDDDSQYSTTGTCKTNYVVVPNHRGYDYIATDLAARGYFVVSINTNRGINGVSGPATDSNLIGARGRMVLRHLQQLAAWDAGSPTPASLEVDLTNRIDFTQVGLFGHSRGGEGVRFAYNEYLRSGSSWPGLIGTPVSFRGIFEIGPTDGGVNGQFQDALGTAWNVLLPACDWDVPGLDGTRVFDRMIGQTEPTALPKSFYHVWGTNHNFYNSEWQQPDANLGGGITGCIDHTPIYDATQPGSAAQREIGRFAAVTFFTANVGADRVPSRNALFDPAFPMPVSTRVRRGYHPGGGVAESRVLEDFIRATGTSSYDLPNTTSGTLTVTHGEGSFHPPGFKIGFVSGVTPSSSTFFQTNFAASGSGFNLSSYNYLDLRVDGGYAETADPISFKVQLVNQNGTISSAVTINQAYADLARPPKGETTLQTARVPLSQFTGAQLTSVRGVRVVFDQPVPAGVQLANVRATKATTPTSPSGFSFAAPSSPVVAPSTAPSPGAQVLFAPISREPELSQKGNLIRRVERVGSDYAITLSSPRFFDLRARPLRLTIGDAVSEAAENPNGDLYTVRFLVDADVYERLSAKDEVRIDYGSDSAIVWEFGELGASAPSH